METLDILFGALEVEEPEPLGLRVSWVKTKIQAFIDILDAARLGYPINNVLGNTAHSLFDGIVFICLLIKVIYAPKRASEGTYTSTLGSLDQHALDQVHAMCSSVLVCRADPA